MHVQAGEGQHPVDVRVAVYDEKAAAGLLALRVHPDQGADPAAGDLEQLVELHGQAHRAGVELALDRGHQVVAGLGGQPAAQLEDVEARLDALRQAEIAAVHARPPPQLRAAGNLSDPAADCNAPRAPRLHPARPAGIIPGVKALSDEAKPRLRNDLRLLPAQAGGVRAVVIQDPLGLLAKPMLLGGQALALLPMLDGGHSVLDIQTELTRRGGVLVTSEQVQAAVDKLDESFLLDSERYREARAAVVREFVAQKTLPCAHAGEAFPPDARAFAGWAEGLLAQGEAPQAEDGEIVAVVAPHIDFRVGAGVYAAAYVPLRGRQYDRVVILGVGHSLGEAPLALTDKDVETPAGTLPCDRELVGELRAAAGEAAAPDDFAFRGEHSVEFQAALLAHVLGAGFRAVPVLCGSFGGALEEHGRAAEVPGVGAFLAALKKAVSEEGTRTLLVAGADLSHVGPKFGDEMSSRAIAEESEEHDRKLLAALTALDAAAFWAEGRRAGGRFNVCGFSALACLLELLPAGTRARQAAYHNWHEEPTRSAVSFAAAVLTR